MATKTPEQITAKFQRGVSAAAPDYAAGVQNPSRPWAASTQAGAQRWQAGIQQAIANNSFARGVQRAGDAKWQEASVNRGAQNYAAAAQHAATQYAAKAGQIAAAGQAARQKAAAMPNATQDQRLQRMVESVKAISQYWQGQKR